MMVRNGSLLCVLAALALPVVTAADPMGAAFTYQGQLKQSGVPVTDMCDFRFSLWDAAGSGSPPSGGNPVGAVQTVSNVGVDSGLFTVELNDADQFGSDPFNGDARWLQIAVRVPHDPNDVGLFTTLAPRQELTPSPYAVRAGAAGSGWGGGTQDYIAKFVGSTTLGDSILYEDTTESEIGIGTAAPQARLHVHRSDAHAGQHPVLVMTNSASGTSLRDGIELGYWSQGSRDAILCNWESGFLSLCTNGIDRMRILSDGSVGIGTSTPDETLSVVGKVRGAMDATETEYVEMSHGGSNAYVNWAGDGNLDLRYNNSTVVTVEQSGRINVNGFKMASGASSGRVLTSDSLGVGTWQSPSGGDITAVYADSGLTGGATSGDAHLNVGAGDGIDVVADAVVVDVTDFAGAGLGEDGLNNLTVVAGDGIDVVGDAVTVDVTDFAGAGLGEDGSNNLRVITGTGLELSGDNVQLASPYSSGTAYDSRFVNDEAGEVDTGDIAAGTVVSGSMTGAVFEVQNNYSGNTYSYGLVAKCPNTSNDWYHWGVQGLAGTAATIWGGMRHAGVFGGGTSGYNYIHGVIGTSLDGRGVWGASSNGYAGYFSGDVHITGNLTADGSKAGWVVDVCYNDDTVDLEAGDVVVLSGRASDVMMYGKIPVPRVIRCDVEADTKVVGVVVCRKKITPFALTERIYEDGEAAAAASDEMVEPLRETEDEAALDESIVPPGRGCNVAILGAIEKCKVDAGFTPIEVGDLLTTSPTPGHAMEATHPKVGTIVGKALEPLRTGTGVIRMTVTLN